LVLAIVAIAGGTSANAQLAGELGILDLSANDGINPATELPWEAGDTYRFSFTSSETTQATSSDINYYNTFVQNLADASPLNVGAAQGVTWKVIGSTATVYARDNTSTNIDVYGTGEATYLLDGTLVAPDYTKLWGSGGASVGLPDGHNNAITLTELLTAPLKVGYGSTFTGVHRYAYPNENYGTADEKPLGNAEGSTMCGLWPATSGTHWIWRWASATTDELPVYALSMPLTVTDGATEPDLPGDANGSGFVDDDDLAVLLSNWEQDPGTITNWALGDFTDDTDVDDDDLAVLLGNWTGPPPGGAAVPEPVSAVLLLIGAPLVARRRKRK